MTVLRTTTLAALLAAWLPAQWGQSPPTAAPAPQTDAGATMPAPTTAPAAAPSPTIQVFPPQIQLDHARDRQRLTVVATTASGITQDLGARATFAVEPPDLATIERSGDTAFLAPRGDGEGALRVTVDGTSLQVPLRVQRATAAPALSFRNEVIPILTRAGCNAGSCHGAAAGKNGFNLSLFGYDPDADHRMLTRELRSRRLDPSDPDQSLMLVKATTAAVHQGGRRIEPDGPLYADLRRWIADGAPDDGTAAPALVGLTVLPAAAVLLAGGAMAPLQVLARYQDGSDRDVTELCLWSSGNDGAAAVAPDGRLTSREAGEACILARFGGLAATAQVMVLRDDAPFTWPDLPETGFIDRHVHQKLRQARVLPAALCADEVFVRRVHLDLCHVLPTTERTLAFLQDDRPDKRARLIDELLARPEFAAAQAMAWAEVLQVDTQTMEGKGAALFGRWLRASFAEGRPLDEVVRAMLTAEGDTFQDPPANFHLLAGQPHLLAEKAAQNFLGVRMQCAQCHNHPFEKWSMDDYYGFAAFFAQTGRKRGEDPYQWVIWDRRYGDIRNARDQSVAPPRLLGQGLAAIPRDTDRRAVLAQWLTAPDNPWFARNVVNRLWAQLFGRGLVDPVDDVRISNPASHPALLDELAQLLVDSRFDVRPVVRAICLSRTYQLGPHPDAPPTALFAGNQVRRLTAEQLLDAITAVTGVATRYPGLPAGAPATEIDGSGDNVRFLDLFGRPDRDSACTCDRRPEPTLGQTLHLINGDTITDKLTDKNGRLRQALAAGTEPSAMLDDLFLAAYSRRPTAAERSRLLAAVTGAAVPASAWQDLYWAVLNSKEFVFQH